jgi:hypothetical protein
VRPAPLLPPHDTGDTCYKQATPQAIGNAPPTDWIPAFAGMTIVSKGILLQMTPVPGNPCGGYAPP